MQVGKGGECFFDVFMDKSLHIFGWEKILYYLCTDKTVMPMTILSLNKSGL